MMMRGGLRPTLLLRMSGRLWRRTGGRCCGRERKQRHELDHNDDANSDLHGGSSLLGQLTIRQQARERAC